LRHCGVWVIALRTEAIKEAPADGDAVIRDEISGITHDLRSSLSVIQGYIQLLDRTELTERQQGYTKAVRERCGCMLRFVDDYYSLAFWSLECATPDLERVNPVGLLTEKLFSMEAEFRRRGVTPETDFPDAPVFVRANPDLLSAVFRHLIENAVRHGIGNLRVSTAASGDDVAIVFENETAPDFLPDAARLFEKYYSTDGMRDGVRVGLGLSIAETFLKKMDGSVAAEVGAGLFTVRVTLQRSLD